MMPRLTPWSSSPPPGAIRSTKTSVISATMVSDWPTPTVSTRTTSAPQASTRRIVSRVRRRDAAERRLARARADEGAAAPAPAAPSGSCRRGSSRRSVSRRGRRRGPRASGRARRAGARGSRRSSTCRRRACRSARPAAPGAPGADARRGAPRPRRGGRRGSTSTSVIARASARRSPGGDRRGQPALLRPSRKLHRRVLSALGLRPPLWHTRSGLSSPYPSEVRQPMPKSLRPILARAASRSPLRGGRCRPAPSEATFDFSVAGIRVGSLMMEGEQKAGRYDARSRIDTAGIVGMFLAFFFDGTSTGSLAGTQVVPGRYDATSKSPRALRKTAIEWKDGTPVKVSVEPPRSTAPDPAKQAGTLDPVSAGFRLLRDDAGGRGLQHHGPRLRRLASLAARAREAGRLRRHADLRRHLRPHRGRGAVADQPARVPVLARLPQGEAATPCSSASRRRPTTATRC